MSMVLSHRTALELYRSSMMPVFGYEKVSFLSLSVPSVMTSNAIALCQSALPIYRFIALCPSQGTVETLKMAIVMCSAVK